MNTPKNSEYDYTEPFDSLDEVAEHLRDITQSNKKYRNILIYAYNGTGKTRLSMAFKERGNPNRVGDTTDTLYFNAFTEDLFVWDNDFKKEDPEEWEPRLLLEQESKFIQRIEGEAIETSMRKHLERYVDFEFTIFYEEPKWFVKFWRKGELAEKESRPIKLSRGEEHIFIWCFFLAYLERVLENAPKYREIKYIYIDDPISSLDENYVTVLAHHLTLMLGSRDLSNKRCKRVIISTHHALFYNMLQRHLKKKTQNFYLRWQKEKESDDQANKLQEQYFLRTYGSEDFFYHIATLAELRQLPDDQLCTYHFNFLRSVLERIASFLGYEDWRNCLRTDEKDDPDGTLLERRINVLNHGEYSLFEPRDMQRDNIAHFRTVLENLIEDYRFNSDHLPDSPANEA